MLRWIGRGQGRLLLGIGVGGGEWPIPGAGGWIGGWRGLGGGQWGLGGGCWRSGGRVRC